MGKRATWPRTAHSKKNKATLETALTVENLVIYPGIAPNNVNKTIQGEGETIIMMIINLKVRTDNLVTQKDLSSQSHLEFKTTDHKDIKTRIASGTTKRMALEKLK